MAVTSQSTLKELVDETGLIKNDLVNCRDNLKNNLSAKGVDTSALNKMSELVNSVKNIKVSSYDIPDWYDLDNFWIPSKNVNISDNAASTDAISTNGNDVYYFAYDKFYLRNLTTTQSSIIVNKGSCPVNTLYAKNAIKNNIYGFSKGNGSVHCYDTVSNTWSIKTSHHQQNIHGFSICIEGDNIHLVGGYEKKDNLYPQSIDRHICYDTVSNTWSTKSAIGQKLHDGNTVLYNSSIYCMGAATYSSSLKVVYVYDLFSNIWSTKLNIPSEMEVGPAFAIGSKIYMFNGVPGRVGSYNPVTNEWTKEMNMLEARNGIAFYNIGSSVYAIGGRLPSSGVNYPYSKESLFIVKNI